MQRTCLNSSGLRRPARQLFRTRTPANPRACAPFMAMLLLLSGSFASGCTRDATPTQKSQSSQVAEATVAPTAAPPRAAEDGDPYEDSLVLLAEGDPDTGIAPLAVQFEVESLVVDEIVEGRYTWDFGDGSPKSNEMNPKHTYEKPGEYTATIGVVDANGEQGWDEVDISVEETD